MKSRLALLTCALAFVPLVFAAEKTVSLAEEPEISVIATVDEQGVLQQVDIERMPSSVSAFAVLRYVKKNLVAVGASPGERIRIQFDATPVLQQRGLSVKPVTERQRTRFNANGPAGTPPRGMGRGF